MGQTGVKSLGLKLADLLLLREARGRSFGSDGKACLLAPLGVRFCVRVRWSLVVENRAESEWCTANPEGLGWWGRSLVSQCPCSAPFLACWGVFYPLLLQSRFQPTPPVRHRDCTGRQKGEQQRALICWDEVEMNQGLYFGRVRADDISVSVLLICDGSCTPSFLFIDQFHRSLIHCSHPHLDILTTHQNQNN